MICNNGSNGLLVQEGVAKVAPEHISKPRKIALQNGCELIPQACRAIRCASRDLRTGLCEGEGIGRRRKATALQDLYRIPALVENAIGSFFIELQE